MQSFTCISRSNNKLFTIIYIGVYQIQLVHVCLFSIPLARQTGWPHACSCCYTWIFPSLISFLNSLKKFYSSGSMSFIQITTQFNHSQNFTILSPHKGK